MRFSHILKKTAQSNTVAKRLADLFAILAEYRLTVVSFKKTEP